MNFVALIAALDQTTKTTAKHDSLVEFIQQGDPVEVALGCAHLLGHRTLKGHRALLRQTGIEYLGDETLFEAAYAAVGDLAETLSLLINDPDAILDRTTPCISQWLDEIVAIQAAGSPSQALIAQLAKCTALSNWTFLKLWTGGWRLGVSQGLVTQALATVTGQSASVIAERLIDDWSADEAWLSRFSQPVSPEERQRSPVPFCLAQGWQADHAGTRDIADYIVEYKWDGIRCQLIRAQGVTRLWSRGEQDITHQFPDVVAASIALPENCLLDGELLVIQDGQPAPFQALQTRLNRKRVSVALQHSHPVQFRAYDLLRLDGIDYRNNPLSERRAILTTLTVDQSPALTAASWEVVERTRSEAATIGAEGLMLKARSGLYHGGRQHGLWWKWKLDPMTADVVLLYAQAGHGRRARLYTDYTFGIRGETGDWITVAKAYSGLTDTELTKIDRWIRQHTIESFGPVRQVEPRLVFEIAFEGIAASRRHKSGIALRFPRILRLRTDLGLDDADQLPHFHALLKARR